MSKNSLDDFWCPLAATAASKWFKIILGLELRACKEIAINVSVAYQLWEIERLLTVCGCQSGTAIAGKWSAWEA